MDVLLEEMDSFQRPAPADRARRRRLVGTAAIVGLAFVGIGQLTTGALFEDSATAAVSYASGNVSIQANGSASTTLAPATNLAPGDTVYRSVNVTNTGSLDLRYAITGLTTVETKNLSTVLRYTVFQGVTNAQCAAGTTGGGTAIASNVTIGTASTPLVGSNANGANPGDRTIAAGAGADALCVAMDLPLATTSTFATATATVQLTFDAEQTKNN
jgi:spore coat-associated protein N